LVTKVRKLLLRHEVDDSVAYAINRALNVASVSFHVEVYTVDSALSLAAAVGHSLVKTVKALTKSLLHVCKALLYCKLIVSLSRHDGASGEATSYVVSCSNSAKFVTYHLVTASVSRPVSVAPTAAKQKEKYPPAVIPAVSASVIVTDALAYGHTF
jgi:hypothetical protein